MSKIKLKEISIYNKFFIKGGLVEVFIGDKIIKCYIRKIKKDCILVEEVTYKNIKHKIRIYRKYFFYYFIVIIFLLY